MTGLSRGGWRILARTAQAAPAQCRTDARRPARGGLRRPTTADRSNPHLMRPTRGAVLTKLCRTVQESRCSRV